jgi:uncharacterized integral membrane protein
MMVTPESSSFGNLSLAFLFWVSITQWTKHRWVAIDIVWLALICVSVIAVNGARIALTGVSQAHYAAIHSPLGEGVAGSIILILIVVFSVLSVRRELFSRV